MKRGERKYVLGTGGENVLTGLRHQGVMLGGGAVEGKAREAVRLGQIVFTIGAWAVMARVSLDISFMLSCARPIKKCLASLFFKFRVKVFFQCLILIQLFPWYNGKRLSTCQCLEALWDSLSR